MKRVTVLCIVAAALSADLLLQYAEARGGGGGGARGGGGGGGARASAARGGASRSAPANYGSLRTTQVAPRAPEVARPQANVRTVETPRGGEVAVGVGAAGAVAVRGVTAGGQNYAGVGTPGGDRVVAGQNRQGEIVARARGDGDGVVDVLPAGARQVYVDNDPYYYYDHRYYWPYYYGGSVYYQEVYPPDGTSSEALPDGTKTVTEGGTTYYVYDDVYYVKQGDQYVVTEKPVETGGPDAAELVKAMCAYIGTYTNFIVDSTEDVEHPGKGASVVKRRILVSRPDRVAAGGRDGTSVTHFWYDGKSVTSLDDAKNVYSTVEAPATIKAMLDMLQEDYGVSIPLTDLLLPDLADELAPVLSTMKYGGKEPVGDALCNKVTLLTADYYAQLWITADEKAPLPRKLDVTYFAKGSKPHYSAVINAWRAQETVNPAQFVFTPPAGAQKIEMLPRE